MNTSKRLVSIDVLRGITISFMILVNTPGDWSFVYAPLKHAIWHGCTPTDLVFPFFLFIVGISVYFSFEKYETKISKNAINKILKRTVIIFSLGLFLNLYPFFNFENVRIMGVLQRISLAYCVGALLCLAFKKDSLLIILALILIGYWGVLYLGSEINPYSLKYNFVRKVDLFFLGEKHIYKGFGIPFDPEGLLSTIPSVGTVIIGFLIGKTINTETSNLLKIKKLLIKGVLLVIIGGVWSLFFPINKALWTSSYVLYTAGLGTLFLAFLIFVIDLKAYKNWTKPFVHFGSNPLFIFVFSGLYVKTISYLIKLPSPTLQSEVSGYKYLFTEVFSPIAGNMNGSLLFALFHITFFWLICFMLYKSKIFIKI